MGVIEAFGMKIPEHLVERKAEIQCHLEERVDILATCGGIPLFSSINEGKVFPLLHMGGFGYGSISLKHNVTLDTIVCIVVYSTLSHHLNSLLHISYNVPASMSGILRKQGLIERFLSDIENVDEESLYMGTVWESLLGSDAEQFSTYIFCFAKQCYLLVLVFVKDVYISQESMESKKGMVKAWSPGYILQSKLVNMQCSFHVTACCSLESFMQSIINVVGGCRIRL